MDTTITSTVVRRVVVDRARDALSRAVRQALQALVPTLLVITAGSSLAGLDLAAVLQLAGVTAFVSICKSAANASAPDDAPVWAQIGERALVAAAGTALGLATIDGTTVSASIAWQGLLTASLGSAVLAVVMWFTNPPVVRGEVVEAASPTVLPVEPDTGTAGTLD